MERHSISRVTRVNVVKIAILTIIKKHPPHHLQIQCDPYQNPRWHFFSRHWPADFIIYIDRQEEQKSPNSLENEEQRRRTQTAQLRNLTRSYRNQGIMTDIEIYGIELRDKKQGFTPMGGSFFQGERGYSSTNGVGQVGIYMLKTSLGPTPHTVQTELQMNHQPKCKS